MRPPPDFTKMPKVRLEVGHAAEPRHSRCFQFHPWHNFLDRKEIGQMENSLRKKEKIEYHILLSIQNIQRGTISDWEQHRAADPSTAHRRHRMLQLPACATELRLFYYHFAVAKHYHYSWLKHSRRQYCGSKTGNQHMRRYVEWTRSHLLFTCDVTP